MKLNEPSCSSWSNYCWLKDMAYCISLEPQEHADFMHTIMTLIFDIYVIIYNIKKIIMFQNEYSSHINDCICKMFYFSTCVLVQVAFQSSFHSFRPCDNWTNTSKIAIAFVKPNFSPNLKSQNKAMDCNESNVCEC